MLVRTSLSTDLATVAQIDSIPSILDIACQATGLRFAAVARVTETQWTACAVRDGLGFGLEVGGELDLKSTICHEIRCSGVGVVIDHVAQDPAFRDHHTPAQYGFESYISMPIFLADGGLFGTLCALDPEPATLSDPATVAMFQRFAQLIGRQIDSHRRLASAEQARDDADVTARHREQFIAILGHDLRNPVASILGGLRLLGKDNLSERSRTVSAHMEMAAQRINRMINDLLDFARGRLGTGIVLNLVAAHDLETSLSGVIAELQLVYPQREIDVTFDFATVVTCDVERITQLLSNLLGNALSHGSPDRPIEVIARSIGNDFTLSVANAGTPIPAEAMRTLFYPFTQASEGKSVNGLGLGLFIANEIAKAHGGALRVRSDVRETRFALTMPCSCG